MSTQTAEAVDPRTIADRIGREIFESLFPHGGPEMGAHRADRQVPEEARLQKVEGPQDVKADDIVLVVDNDSWRSALDRFSGLEALRSHGSWVGRVVKVSPRSIVVSHIRESRRHSFSADLEDFGVPAFNDGGERLMFSHATREIGRIGSLTDLRKKITAHPKLEEWRAARAAAIDAVNAEQAEAKARREASEARLAPVKDAIERLNRITRQRLVELSFGDDIKAASDWLAEGDFAHMQVYICGLNAVGTITEEQRVEALRYLDVIISYAKGEK